MTKEELILKEDYDYDEIKGIWSKHWEKFLTGYVNKYGYVEVTLNCVDGKRRSFLYHRALWFLAYGPIPEGLVINHINECKNDNRLENLEVCTVLYNNTYNGRHLKVGAKHIGLKHTEEAKAKIAKKRSKAVVAIDNEGNAVMEFPSTKEAGKQGFRQSAVAACCRNCYSTHKGNYYKDYYWYFKSEWEKLVWEKEQKRLHYKLT